MIPFLLALMALANTPETLRRCHLSVGAAHRCEGTAFTGTTPVELESGRVRECRVSIGKVAHCTGSYNGTAVLFREGKHRSCEVRGSRVIRCGATGFNGWAVIRH